jgi:hypothetical protein
MARTSKKIEGISDDYIGKSTPVGVAFPGPYLDFLEKVVKASHEFTSLNDLIKKTVAINFPSPPSLAEEVDILNQIKANSDEKYKLEMEQLSAQNKLEIEINDSKKPAQPLNGLAPSSTRPTHSKTPVSNLSNNEITAFSEFEHSNLGELTIIWEQNKDKTILLINDEDGEVLQENVWNKDSIYSNQEYVLNQASGLSKLWSEQLHISEPAALTQAIVETFEKMRDYE